MTLHDYLVRYNLSRDIRPATLEHYEWVIKSLHAFLGRQVCLEELTGDLLNRYLLWMREKGCSPFTVKNRRNSLLVLWRSANDEGLAPPVEKVRRISVPEPAKDVWTPEEVAKLVSSCDILGGRFRKTRIMRAPYFRTMILAGYDTGLRQSDLHAIRAMDVQHDTIGIVQIKTSRQVSIRIRPSTVDKIRSFLGSDGRQLVWPKWTHRRGAFSRLFKRIVENAELHGTFGKLRKTSGTEVEREQPGVGWVHLGHSNPQTARVWYINQARAYSGNVPMPPELPLGQR